MNSERPDSNPFNFGDTELYIKATITFVDTINNVFDAISDDQQRFIRKCQYLRISPDFSGEIKHPSAGNTCIVKLKADGSAYLEEIYVDSAVNANGIPTVDLGPYAKFMPGDKVWLAKGGAFLKLLRGGLTKIGVSSLCQLVFMKLENYARLITRNLEILTSGFRLTVVNDGGENSLRLSLFLTDAMGPALRDQSSNASDFEIQVADQAITIFTGPKDAKGIRQNNTQIDFVNNGDIFLWNLNPATQSVLRRIKYTADGCSEDTIYGNSNDILYQKNITRIKPNIDASPSPFVQGKDLSKPLVSVTELVVGDYNVIADGRINLTAGGNIETNGNNIFAVAKIAHAIEANGHSVTANVKT